MLPMRAALLGAAVIGLLMCAASAAGVAQSEPPLDPMGASFWVGDYADVQPPNVEFGPAEGHAEAMGVASEGILTASDPRISGRWRQVMNMWAYESREPGGPSATVWSATARIDNDAGAWVGTFTGFMDPTASREWNLLKGEGAYEGLTALFRWLPEESMQEGVIVPGDLPPWPDPVEP